MWNQSIVPNNTPVEEDEPKILPSASKVREISAAKLKPTRSTKVKKKRGSIQSNSSYPYQTDSSKSLHLVKCSCDKALNELYLFIDDFVNSQEYQDYLDFKRNVIREDKEVQYDAHDLLSFETAEKPKRKKVDCLRALSRRALRVFFLEAQIKRYLENMSNIEILRRQEEAIVIIRQKIAEVKQVFLCNTKEKQAERERREKQLIENFINRYNIDISKMLSVDKLGEAILDIERKLRMRRKRHKNNTKTIIEKLLKEFRQNKEIKRERKISQTKKWNMVNAMNEDTVFHIEGKKGSQVLLSSIQIVRKDDPIKKAFEEAGVCLKKEIEEEPLNSNFYNEESSNNLPGEERSEKFSTLDDISSLIPKEENMFKIKLTQNAKEKLGIMESFVKFEDLLEARHFFCTCEKERKEKENAWLNYPLDTTIITHPKDIVFKVPKEDRIYRKRLILRTKSLSPVRLRFFKFHFEEIHHSLHFEIDPDETRIAKTGLPIDFVVKYHATKKLQNIGGALVFLTCYNSRYYRFVVPVKCIKPSSEVLIDPLNLSFGVIPIWKLSRDHQEISKFIKMKCSKNGAHRLVIKRVDDPLEIDTSQFEHISSTSSDESSQRKRSPIEIEMEEIVNDIIKNVDSCFRFDGHFLKISEKSGEQTLKIAIRDINHPGYYFEKYDVDIYKEKKHDCKYHGTQEIMISAEVTDYFIKCEPICVDFGICYYGTAYQASFNILNTSKSIHSLSVRIPSLLNYYVSLDESSMFLKAGEKRRVAVRVLPSMDIISDKCKYLDPDTSILYFPICVKLNDKKHFSVPPTIQHCYAILNDSSDLILDPEGDREHFTYEDGKMVLDLGQCSINETVTARILLRNFSYSKRWFGFLNLPKYITIMPNYGFGTINSFGEVPLNLYLHPRVEDFRSQTNGKDTFSQNRNVTIEVDNITHLGKFRRKPNISRLMKLTSRMLEEMKQPVDAELIGIISDTMSSIRIEIGLNQSSSENFDPTDNPDLTNEVEDLERTNSDLDTKLQVEIIQEVNLSNTKLEEENLDHDEGIDYIIDIHVKEVPPNYLNEEKGTKPDQRPSLLMKKNVNSLETLSFSTITSSLENLSETLSRQLYLKMVFKKPLYEFSFNYMEFPPTPGGSYSVMTTELRPLKHAEPTNSCHSRKKKEEPKFRAIFRVAGGTQEMRIEPTCGVLNSGESIKLTVVATPKMKDDIVADYVLQMKKEILYSLKMENELRRKEALVQKANKNKSKNKKEKKKRKSVSNEGIEAENTKIEVTSAEVQVEYEDLYPAELALWRQLEPYFLNTNFVCRVDYETDETWSHEPDIFPLHAICKVVSPDFIHDQKAQHLDLGQVPIGDIARKIVTVQNVTYHDITVTTSILKPEGNFFCPNFDSMQLPSECFLKIPITYTPTQVESVQEFMEIVSGKTVYQFVLSAEAVMPNVRLEPSAKVIRLSVKRDKAVEVPFEIINDSRVPVRVTLEKVCELEGKIERARIKSEKLPNKKGGKEKIEKNHKSASPKRKTLLNYTDELTEDEINAIENDFSIRKEPTFFHLRKEDSFMTIAESSKKTFKIGFGPPATEIPGKKNKKRVEVLTKEEDVGKVFVAKFNVLIGTSSFLKDFILLGEIK